jgi:hypothetical protein
MNYKLLQVFCVLFILAGLSACQPKETDLPFETIEQRDASGTGQVYKDEKPGLIVITAPEEATNLDALITSEAQARLARLSYDEYFVIAVFQGRKPTTRYGVQIERIARQGSKVTVYAQFSEPKPDEEKAPEETSPYHLIQVQKVGTWGQEVTFELIVKGSIVASVSQYIP